MMGICLFISCKKKTSDLLTNSDLSLVMKNAGDLNTYFEKSISAIPLQGLAEFKVEQDDLPINPNGKLSFKKDSSIVAVVQALGFEVGRGYLCTDSICYLNRMDQNWESWNTKQPMPLFGTGTPTIGFAQNIFMGLPPLLGTEKQTFELRNQKYIIQGNAGPAQIQCIVDSASLRMMKWRYVDLNSNLEIHIEQSNFQDVPGFTYFPMHRAIQINKNGTVKRVILNFTKVDFTEYKAYRFEVPTHYERVLR